MAPGYAPTVIAYHLEGLPMIVDFQHHFTPRELIKEDPGDRLILHYDAQGAPSYTIHKLLYDRDEHVRMMDAAGIDAAWLTFAPGLGELAFDVGVEFRGRRQVGA